MENMYTDPLQGKREADNEQVLLMQNTRVQGYKDAPSYASRSAGVTNSDQLYRSGHTEYNMSNFGGSVLGGFSSFNDLNSENDRNQDNKSGFIGSYGVHHKVPPYVSGRSSKASNRNTTFDDLSFVGGYLQHGDCSAQSWRT